MCYASKDSDVVFESTLQWTQVEREFLFLCLELRLELKLRRPKGNTQAVR